MAIGEVVVAYPVSILTRPEGRVLPSAHVDVIVDAGVSILTRPEGRVLRGCWHGGVQDDFVSILTRPEGRVLLANGSQPEHTERFQSSPDPKAGCYPSDHLLPPPLGCFNPHPTRRPGATAMRGGVTPSVAVSILTRPEGRVLPLATIFSRRRWAVSILTRPEGRVLPFELIHVYVLLSVSILTRPEGRVLHL